MHIVFQMIFKVVIFLLNDIYLSEMEFPWNLNASFSNGNVKFALYLLVYLFVHVLEGRMETYQFIYSFIYLFIY